MRLAPALALCACLLTAACRRSSASEGTAAAAPPAPEPRANAPAPMAGDVHGSTSASTVAAYNGSTVIPFDAGGLGCNVQPSNPGQFAVASATLCFVPTSVTGDLLPSTDVPGYLRLATISGGVNGYVQFISDAGVALLQAGPFSTISSDFAFYGGGVTPGNSNYSMLFTTTGQTTIVNAGTQDEFALNGVIEVQIQSGFVGLKQPLGGYTVPLSYYRQTQPLDAGVPVDAGLIAVTPDASVTAAPHILFIGTLPSNVLVILPPVIGACWYLDFAFVTFAGNTVTLQASGVNWGTAVTSGTSEYYVCYGDIGRLYGTALTE